MKNLIAWFSNFFFKADADDNEEKIDEILEGYLSDDVDETLTGTVSNVKEGFVEIDSRYIGQCIDNFKIGQQVSYVLHKTKTNECITDVKPYIIDVEPVKSYFTIIGHIQNREGSVITVNDVNYSLEGVESSFVPCTGDKVGLTVYESLEHDKISRNLVEIYPYRKYFAMGEITMWNGFEGVINKNIYFNRNQCNIASSINLGDRILICFIDSTKDNFKHRALHIETSSRRSYSKSVFIEELSNMSVIAKQKKYFEVNVFNLSNRWQDIVSCSLEPSNEFIKLEGPIDLKQLPPETCVSYNFSLNPSGFVGKIKIKIIWTFSKFILRRSCYVKIIGEDIDPWTEDKEQGTQVILSAPRYSRKPNFRMLPLDSYDIPQNMKNVFDNLDTSDMTHVISQIQTTTPTILDELTPYNYRSNLHCLLYLEELAIKMKMSQLEMVTPLNRKGDNIVLHLEPDSPHYEMLHYGDKILALVIWDESILFEGEIKDISSTELVAQFHPKFIKDFANGRMYKIKFKPSRTQMRRQHQAVDVCLKLLEKRIFPKCVPILSSFNLFEVSRTTWINSKLNEEQKNAIINILEQKPGDLPYIIFGPPGSGKTITLLELILQIIQLHPFSKILVVAPSNSSVDAIGIHLLASGILMKQQILRLGSLRYFLRGDVAIGLSEVAFFVTDSGNDLDIKIPCIDFDSLGKHNITLGTFSTIGLLTNLRFKKNTFSHIIIDEAGQVTEPECLIPMRAFSVNTGNIVLCGDPLQLGPVCLSKQAAFLGLQNSLLLRLVERYPYLKDKERFSDSLGYDPRILTKLILNYRALPELVEMSSSLFYDNELKPTISAEDSTEAKLLEQIKISFNRSMGSLLFHHVSGGEEQPIGSTSWLNTAEAIKVTMFLVKLYSAGVSPDQIGIITPYRRQTKFIIDYIQQINIIVPKVGSVEEFQGLEKDIIILTLVRSNDKNPNSFINEPKRINVATSRAKTLLLIVGNKPALVKNPIWGKLIHLCQEVYF